MFAIEVALLTGRYVATQYNDRDSAEWPPHPARVYSALVAAHLESEEQALAEREALLWLERQGPPAIVASEASRRDMHTVFVPVNDPSVLGGFEREYEGVLGARERVSELKRRANAAPDPKLIKEIETAERALCKAVQALERKTKRSMQRVTAPSAQSIQMAHQLLPEHRGKQPRSFPSVTPVRPRFSMVWPRAEPKPAIRQVLDELIKRLSRVGHSSSLVSAWVAERSEAPHWTPVDDAASEAWVPSEASRLRVVQLGQLQRLQDAHLRHQGVAPRVLPASIRLYRRVTEELPRAVVTSHFGEDWVVLASSRTSRLPIVCGAEVANSVRAALLKFATDPPPEALSGHQSDGAPSQNPHLAVVPLPAVGFPHADGTIKGVALILPRMVSTAERRAVYQALMRWERSRKEALPGGKEQEVDLPVHLGRRGAWAVRILRDAPFLSTLRSESWCRASRLWVSVTPVALDKNPGSLVPRPSIDRARAAAEVGAAAKAAAEAIAVACTRIGLPRPHVDVVPYAPLASSRKARFFAPFPRERSRTQRVLTHAVLTFSEPVRGPLLVGAGRYLGLGLFRPEFDA